MKSKIIVTATTVLFLYNSNIVIASDIFDGINSNNKPTVSNVQSAATNPDSSQKKCTRTGQVISCTGSGTITRDISGGNLGDIGTLAPLAISVSAPPVVVSPPVYSPPGITPPVVSDPTGDLSYRLNEGGRTDLVFPLNGIRLPGGLSVDRAYEANPSMCAGKSIPALERVAVLEIDYSKWLNKNGVGVFALKPNSAIIYKFNVPITPFSGGFLYNDHSAVTTRPTFMVLSQTPCDFDLSKVAKNYLIPGVDPGFNISDINKCYADGINGNSINFTNVSKDAQGNPVPTAYCKVVPGATYYFSIRMQDARPPNKGGPNPPADSCAGTSNSNGESVCGGIFQVF